MSAYQRGSNPVDCITYSQLIFMPKKEKRVQSTSLQRSFSIRNDKLFDSSFSVRLQRTGLLNFTFKLSRLQTEPKGVLAVLFFPTQGRGGCRIFFRRGCTRLLLYFNTNKPHSFFLQNTSCIRKPQVISGGGGCAPPAPSP